MRTAVLVLASLSCAVVSIEAVAVRPSPISLLKRVFGRPAIFAAYEAPSFAASTHVPQLASDDLQSAKAATVQEHMSRTLITLSDSMTLKDASCHLIKHGISGAPVLDPSTGQLVGMLSQTDLLYKAAGRAKVPLITSGLGAATVRYASNTIKLRKARADHIVSAMTRPVVSVTPKATIQEAAALLLRHHVSRLPVVDESGKLVGIITTTDVMQVVSDADSSSIQLGSK